MASKPAVVNVMIEQGARQVFARALDWPGWCRKGKSESDALGALHDHADRYASVAALAKVPFPGRTEFEVCERRRGSATTDFGAPAVESDSDRRPLEGRELEEWIALLRASWSTLDAVAATSSEALARGPRGGGRDLTAIVNHVREAERAYGPRIGVRTTKAGATDPTTIPLHRDRLCDALRASSLTGTNTWSARYFIHRSAWHVLDHAWEIQDKQT